MLCLIKDKGTS